MEKVDSYQILEISKNSQNITHISKNVEFLTSLIIENNLDFCIKLFYIFVLSRGIDIDTQETSITKEYITHKIKQIFENEDLLRSGEIYAINAIQLIEGAHFRDVYEFILLNNIHLQD